jgi:hypothetical protein
MMTFQERCAFWLLTPLLCALLAGCTCESSGEKGESAATVAASASAAATPAASAQPDLSEVPVPTEEDFEEAAERDITVDNLEAELDRMEKEIGQ